MNHVQFCDHRCLDKTKENVKNNVEVLSKNVPKVKLMSDEISTRTGSTKEGSSEVTSLVSIPLQQRITDSPCTCFVPSVEEVDGDLKKHRSSP